MSAEIIQVIRSDDMRLGDGTPEHPIRRVTRYYSLDGTLLWEDDPLDRAVSVNTEEPQRGTD